MFTEKQRKIFNEVLDLNWKSEKEVKKFSPEWVEAQKEMGKKLNELKEDMGEEEYNRFMSNGRAMFAPKQ
jgi:hypothetical protein